MLDSELGMFEHTARKGFSEFVEINNKRYQTTLRRFRYTVETEPDLEPQERIPALVTAVTEALTVCYMTTPRMDAIRLNHREFLDPTGGLTRGDESQTELDIAFKSDLLVAGGLALDDISTLNRFAQFIRHERSPNNPWEPQHIAFRINEAITKYVDRTYLPMIPVLFIHQDPD